MLKNTLFVVLLPLVKAGEYFVGYCHAIRESGEYFVGIV